MERNSTRVYENYEEIRLSDLPVSAHYGREGEKGKEGEE
jgi:hypothetical protein